MKTKIQIKSIIGKVLFEFEKEDNSIKDTVQEAVKSGAYLRKANLYGADLRGANLYKADLSGANLYKADLSEAYLRKANLYGADLRGANLSEANLSEANLYKADLSGANLYKADLSGANLYKADLSEAYLRKANLSEANLSEANLYKADLSGANLRGANLRGADLYGADLRGANLSKFIHLFRIVPEEGSFIAWKKGKDNHLIKLEIPADAKRHNYIGSRKCRAEFVKVLDIRNSKGHKVKTCYNGAYSQKIEYTTGKIVRPDSYDPDPTKECSNGIHFFLTKQEAKEWSV